MCVCVYVCVCVCVCVSNTPLYFNKTLEDIQRRYECVLFVII